LASHPSQLFWLPFGTAGKKTARPNNKRWVFERAGILDNRPPDWVELPFS
jgi:hypothetical protein